MTRIGVVGCGAWGSALANVIARAGAQVTMWARRADIAAEINERRTNDVYLPGVAIADGIAATPDLGALADAEAVFMVVPAQYSRKVLGELAAADLGEQPLVLCSKGIERETGLLMSEMAAEVVPHSPLAVLSGPTFAVEVAQDKPAAVTLACADEALGAGLIDKIGLRHFRPYYSSDVIGAQVGGAVKNVLAIAAGIEAGLGLGENARAALITRGLAEMMRFGEAKGGRRETLMGLSGVGDLILTCASTQSRNMSLGKELGEGRSVEDILSARRSVAEGMWTADVLVRLGEAAGVDMPICAAVSAVIDQGADLRDVMTSLLERPFKHEEA